MGAAGAIASTLYTRLEVTGQEANLSLPPGRTIAFQQGRPLATAVRTDDSTLLVRSGQHSAPIGASPAGLSEVEFKTRVASFVALVRINQRQSALTPHGDWITSTVSARVLEVMKNTSGREVSVGSAIEFVEEGGEVRIGQQRVLGFVPWAKPIRVNAQYLIFAATGFDGSWVVSPVDTYEVVNNRAVSQNVERKNDAVLPAEIQEITREVRQKASLPPRYQ